MRTATLCSNRPGHVYTLTPQPNGTTEPDIEVVRDDKNLRGRLAGLLLGTVGDGVSAMAVL
jgi:hypothetical protein